MGCGSSRESLRKEGADNYWLVDAQFLPLEDWEKITEKLAAAEANEENAKKVAAELKAHHKWLSDNTDDKANAVYNRYSVKDAKAAVEAVLTAFNTATGIAEFALAPATTGTEGGAANDGGAADLAGAIATHYVTSAYFRHAVRSAGLKTEQGVSHKDHDLKTAAAILATAVKAGADEGDFFVGGHVSQADFDELTESKENKRAIWFSGAVLGHASEDDAKAATTDGAGSKGVVFKYNGKGLKNSDKHLVWGSFAQIENIEDKTGYHLVTLKTPSKEAAPSAPADGAAANTPAEGTTA